MSLVIFDSRVCNFSSVECEAGAATFRKLASEWIIKQFIHSRGCRALPHPVYAALPSRVDTAEVGEVSPADRAFARTLVSGALECCCAPQVLSLQTFAGFALDAVNKFALLLEKRGGSPSPRLSVVVLTTDVNMFSTTDKAGIEQGAAAFVSRIREVSASLGRPIDVSVVCVIVSSPPDARGNSSSSSSSSSSSGSSSSSSSQHRAVVMSRASAAFAGCSWNGIDRSSNGGGRSTSTSTNSTNGNSHGDGVEDGSSKLVYLSVIENSAIYFSLEMTRWLGAALSPVCVDVCLPAVGSTQANVVMQLSGVDLASHEWMETHLRPPRTSSSSSTAPASTSATNTRRVQLESVGRVSRGGIDPLHLRGQCLVALPATNRDVGHSRCAENYRIYRSFVAALAASDSILLLAHSSSSSSTAPSSSYPHRNSSSTTPASGLSYVTDMFALVPPDAASAGRARAEGRCPHMVLMALRDRESVLHQFPFEGLATAACEAPGTDTSRGGGRGGSSDDTMMVVQGEEEELDDDEYGEFAALCVEEAPLELMYNPMNHPSGRIDIQVRDVIEAITSNAPQSSARPGAAASNITTNNNGTYITTSAATYATTASSSSASSRQPHTPSLPTPYATAAPSVVPLRPTSHATTTYNTTATATNNSTGMPPTAATAAAGTIDLVEGGGPRGQGSRGVGRPRKRTPK